MKKDRGTRGYNDPRRISRISFPTPGSIGDRRWRRVVSSDGWTGEVKYRRMSCRQAFRRRSEAIAREAVGAAAATMLRIALAGSMIGAIGFLFWAGFCRRKTVLADARAMTETDARFPRPELPKKEVPGGRSSWWTLWAG